MRNDNVTLPNVFAAMGCLALFLIAFGGGMWILPPQSGSEMPPVKQRVARERPVRVRDLPERSRPLIAAIQ